MPTPLMVTKRYEGQRITSWRKPTTQTNMDPNRDKTFARSNHPRISATYRRQDDVFGHFPCRYNQVHLLLGHSGHGRYKDGLNNRRLSWIFRPFNTVNSLSGHCATTLLTTMLGLRQLYTSTRFSLNIENDQAGAGRDGKTRLPRPSQARTGTGKYSFFPFQLTTSRIGNLTRLIHILLFIICDGHTTTYHLSTAVVVQVQQQQLFYCTRIAVQK